MKKVKGMISLKTKAAEWVSLIYKENSLFELDKSILNYSFYFKLEGFADEPEVYLQKTKEGIECGYEATGWDGYMPSVIPVVYKKHTLSWENLQPLTKDEQQQLIVDLLMKTITSRKRQYRKCQYCNDKVAVEHRFNSNTCHGCASDYLGVDY